MQAQINLDGIVYDCDRAAITMSCPRINEDNLVVDQCHGETLECDVRMRLNSRSVSCTNGTLISNHSIVCKSATLMEKKNVLNCAYKSSFSEIVPTSTHSPSQPFTRLPSQPITRPQYTTTSRPIIAPHVSLVPPPPVVEDNRYDHENIDVRYSLDKNNRPQQPQGLLNEVKQAMKAVFPHELLSVASSNMYLPPKVSSASQLPEDLKNELRGVFPYELFAISQTDLNTNEVNIGSNQLAEGLSLQQRANSNKVSEALNTQNLQSQWDLKLNRNTANTGPSFKTDPNIVQGRFRPDNNDDEDRLIFSP